MESSAETFRIPGTLHRLLLGAMVLGLLPAGVVIPLLLMPLGTGVLSAVVVAGALLLLARKYTWVIARRVEVSPAGLRIVWPLRSRRIERHEITDAQLVLWETIDPPQRWTGDGYHGLWDSPDLGHVELYATKPGNLAMVHVVSGPPLLLGVEFADELVEAIETDLLGRGTL